VLLALCSACAWSKCELQAATMPVMMAGQRAVVRVLINGIETPLVLDSGAYFSSLTEAGAAQLKLQVQRAPMGLQGWGLTGAVDHWLTRVDTLGLQGAKFNDVQFLVGGNEAGAGTLGLLGRNLLNWADNEYDLRNGAIRFVKPVGDCADTGLAYWAGSAPVSEVRLRTPRDERHAAIRADALVNGQPVNVLFDTGATSMLSLKAARRVGLVDGSTQRTPAGRLHGAGAGEVESWTVPMESFELGQEHITHSRLRVAEFDLPDGTEMLIGIDFFLSHRIYVAWGQRRMYFTYQGGPVFDLSAKVAASESQAPEGDLPTDADAWARRGAARLARRDFTGALGDLDRACELLPSKAGYFKLRARVHLRLGQRMRAVQDYSEALRLDPAEHEARFERAQLAAALGDTPATHADLQALDRDLAPQSDTRRGMGHLYLSLGMPEQAIVQFDHWVAAHDTEVDLHAALNSRCWARALADKDLDAAESDCNAALEAKPENAAYLDSRGLLHLRRGQLKEALDDYDRALKIDPTQAWSLYCRGLARLRSGQPEPGAADIAAARQLRPAVDAEAQRYGLRAP
jgi:tetratricopeptide (TPR) repeat protein/predicted aspartyl protease